jgi:hypothetical protein
MDRERVYEAALEQAHVHRVTLSPVARLQHPPGAALEVDGERYDELWMLNRSIEGK